MATKPGERKTQILQVLAEMLQTPNGEKITTAALAAKVGVSEAALYRHFASKAQMFEALIEFIEESVFSLVNHITQTERDGRVQMQQMGLMLLNFAEKNPGMVRVLIGDALVNEDGRLQSRINQLIDRIEVSFKQAVQLVGVTEGQAVSANVAAARANLLTAYVVGRWHQHAKTGFKRAPTEYAAEQLAVLAR
jgi:TetR/AcrR family transcriptional regulator